MREFLQRIATGPEHSKDLTREDANEAIRLILEQSVNPVQAGVFLIALRMKRESDDEHKGALDAVRAHTRWVTADVDEVLDVADPYDGFARSLPASSFLPAILAACGVPSVIHGVETVGPKFGLTHARILREAGVPVDLDVGAAARRLSNPEIGWAYVDQAEFCPELHALVELRRLIVKRPVLTTIEVLAAPVRGRRKTHWVTGYVHNPYVRIYSMLASYAGFDSALIVRGIEGGVIPSLRQPGHVHASRSGLDLRSFEIHPRDLGIEQPVRAVPLEGDLDGAAGEAARAGQRALEGEPGPTRDALLYGASLCLLGLASDERIEVAAGRVREALASGAALRRLHAAQGTSG